MHRASSRSSLVFAAIALLAFSGAARADNGVTPVIVQNPVTLYPGASNPVTLNPAAPNQVTLGNPGDVAKVMGIQHPFEFFQRTLFGENFCTVTVTLPTKQRAVIEYVSGETTLPPGTPLLGASLFTSTQNSLTALSFQQGVGGTGHDIPIADHIALDDSRGGRLVVFGQTLRAYADAGSDIIAALTTPPPGANPDAFCFISLSGQLIDVP